ncbi:MAG: hypothetical protein MUC43_16810 [Pirellula sp.]|nr:hypothetical protein [Pirellula sp.]
MAAFKESLVLLACFSHCSHGATEQPLVMDFHLVEAIQLPDPADHGRLRILEIQLELALVPRLVGRKMRMSEW